ncbi:MAG: YfiR family protein [Bacteroidetes bacterium]|nr:YfiR family protein [Bacteroidota bacterium]
MRKGIAILIALFCLSADWVRMPVFQEPNISNSKIKAIFLYNFTKYINWPDKYKEGNFVIGILGTSPFYNDLNTLIHGRADNEKEIKKDSKKKVGNQEFEIKNFLNIESITGTCHILFIPADHSADLPEVLKKMKGKSTLIVTEKAGLARQGAAINFVIENNKQRFELNKINIEKYNLKVSSTLEALAIKVE